MMNNAPECGNQDISPRDEERNDRTITLIGEDAFKRLANSRVLVAGLGGVGGYAAETLLRSGIGNLTIIDADDVAPSNINRQLIATSATIGMSKAILFAERFHEINPEAQIDARCIRLTPDNISDILEEGYDFVVDAIDTVAPKTSLIVHCINTGIPIISSMGAGGRIDPTKICYADIWQTRDDGLARAVRQRLKKLGIRKRLDVVASSEPPARHSLIDVVAENKRSSFGTLATIPAIFGLFMANFVIRKITGI